MLIAIIKECIKYRNERGAKGAIDPKDEIGPELWEKLS